jgi:hypothetical protein
VQHHGEDGVPILLFVRKGAQEGPADQKERGQGRRGDGSDAAENVQKRAV